jgi:hypothetical protein
MHPHDDYPMREEDLSYALAHQIPDMTRGVAIETHYGRLELHGPDADKIAALCKKLVRRRLDRIDRQRALKR